jgi:adenine-specific DNA-methyltransferase
MKKLTAEDAETRSPDVVAENVEQLKTIFPEAFTEEKVDFEVLKQLLGGVVEEREEKYGLNWYGKRRARQLALTPSNGTLRPCPAESVDWDTTRNLMIEGDNLEVLKLLQKSYSGKVKLIYIDPPYNTGKDFVYPDDFRDSIKNYLELTGQVDGNGNRMFSNTESSGRFHTDWLNMMYPRLMLARNLLRDDGVILVSIDDHEVQNIRALLNDSFGEENFVANIVWEKGRKNDAKLLSVGHEYLLLFARSLSVLRELGTVWREDKPGARDIWDEYLRLRKKYGDNDKKIQEDLEEWYSGLPKSNPAKKWSRYRRIDKNGPWRDRDISWPGGGGPRYDVLHPRTKQPCKVPERGWIYATIEEMERQIRIGVVEFREDHTEPPFRKAHIRPLSYEMLESEDVDESEDTESDELATQVRGSYFYKQSQVSVKYLRDLFGAKVFNNPKDFIELARLFEYFTSDDRDAVFLDFFAGSGSSADAVMSLNQADGGARRFIICQLPECLDSSKKEQKASAAYCEKLGKPLNIAELTKERLRRSGAKIKSDSPLFHGDLGFRVFKLDTTSVRPWDPTLAVTAETLPGLVENILPGRTEKDLLYELLLKRGLELAVSIEAKQIAGKQVYAVGAGTLIACLAPSIAAADVEALSDGIIAWHKQLAPDPAPNPETPKAKPPKFESPLIVFRDSAFVDDVAKSNLTEILKQHGLTDVRSL